MKEKTLIIAEKTSAARALMEGLGDDFTFHQCGKKAKPKMCQAGYYESSEKIVTYARGHLFRLYNVEEYFDLPEKSPWQLNTTPYIPDDFKLKITSDEEGFCKTQFSVINELLHREDVTLIVNFGDPDNEGELLIREILNEAGNTKPVKRLYSTEQLPSVLANEYYNLKPANDYLNMYYEALARQQTDWMLGIALTRFLKIKTDTLLPVGRVLIPIVKYIYDRDKEIKEFDSKCSYGIDAIIEKGDFKKTLYTSTPVISFNQKDKTDCDLLNKELSDSRKIVESVKIENKRIRPQKMFILSTFCGEMNTKYGYNLNEGTKVAQKLYETGFISYPRTDSQYLGSNEIDNTKEIVRKLISRGNNLTFHTQKSVFDDTKIISSGHTALIVTTKIPTDVEFKKFSKAEKDGYLLILNRFMSNFSTLPVIEETTVKIKVKDYVFAVTGHRIIEEGFLKYESRPIKDSLPEFSQGELVKMLFKTVERKTVPPSKITVKKMLDYLRNPYVDEIKVADKQNDIALYQMLKCGVTLGKESTMNNIIGSAIKYGYITASTKSYSITDKGVSLIELLETLNINLFKERNIEMNKAIVAVGNRALSLYDNKMNIKEELENIVNQNANVNISVNVSDNEIIGVCPKCGMSIVENVKLKGYGCTGYKNGCTFKIFTNDKYFAARNKKITKTIAKQLLAVGQTKLTNLASKNNTKYSIIIKADYSGEWVKYTSEFIK